MVTALESRERGKTSGIYVTGKAGKMRRFKHVYQFRIQLKEIKPPIWRRIQVPEVYTFWDLHVAIQDAMGWVDYHLHEFTIKNPSMGKKVQLGIPFEDDWDDEPFLPGWEHKIAAYFTMENATARYLYDFGDGWVHTVRLEGIEPRDTDIVYPICVGGKRACPPEDCGGVHGYEDLLAIINDRDHEEHQSTMEWLNGGFGPDKFSPKQVKFDDPMERWNRAFREP